MAYPIKNYLLQEAKYIKEIDSEAAIYIHERTKAKIETLEEENGAKLEPEMTEEESRKYWAEPVKIKLFKDSGKYKDDLFVAVNGKSYQIKRGVEVEVPRNVAEVIAQAQENEENNSVLFEEMSSEFQEKSKRFE